MRKLIKLLTQIKLIRLFAWASEQDFESDLSCDQAFGLDKSLIRTREDFEGKLRLLSHKVGAERSFDPKFTVVVIFDVVLIKLKWSLLGSVDDAS